MAQAARLNLRMQKELKLILTDPPPGAFFPQLSTTSDLSSFSLAAIDAQIEGPEGTVYEKGFFKIKIQIPERYPFQPPIVTFNTPIYHPNIDTGGRICLDILNLPPKGAWQPSLNISTVLTSIGLLLSEPNPDDGLMCEASREYKYNKQAFDQKARSMTEKYARSDSSPNHSRLLLFPESSRIEAKAPEPAKSDMNKYSMSFKNLSGISRKLSLDASGLNTKDSDIIKMHEVPSNTLKVHAQIQETNQDSKDTQFKYSNYPGSIKMNQLDQDQDQDQDEDQDQDQDQENKREPISSKKLCISGKNLKLDVMDLTKRKNETIPAGIDVKNAKKFVSEANPKRKKLGLTGKKRSLGFLGLAQNKENDDKENMSKMVQVEKIVNSTAMKLSRKPLQVVEETDDKNVNLELCDSEAVIVLDSEDSEEEKIIRPVARKRLLRKWEAKR